MARESDDDERRIEIGIQDADLAGSTVTYHESTGTFRTEFDCETRPPSVAVVTTVASATGQDSMALPPLYRAIDTDALDQLFTSTPIDTDITDKSASFQYAGHAVTVKGHGSIEIEPLQEISK